MVGLPQFATMMQPQQQPVQDIASPFTWGAGGAQITPEELANRRAIAQNLMKSNYSPISSVWQGLGRVADNVLGAIDARQLDKQSAAATERSNAVAQALLGGKGGDIAAQAMIDPYVSPEVQGLAGKMWDRANPKPVSNDTVNDFNFWKQTLPPDQFNTWLQNKIDPPQYRQGPDGHFYRIDTGQATAPKPVTMDDWNSARPMGGGAGNGAGGFHIPSGNPLDAR